jgi:putative hemolysin
MTTIRDLGREVPWARPFLPLRRLEKLCQKAAQQDAPSFFDALLRALDVRCEFSPRELEHIPASGPAVIFANHPFGMLDGLVLPSLALRVRGDVKILINNMMGILPELESYSIFVNNFGTGQQANTRGLREAIRFLRSGGLLIVFPAGEVSHWKTREWRVTDTEWNVNGAGIARIANAQCIPVHIGGHNSVPFQLAGMVHARLRTLRLAHELLNKRGATVRVRIGAPVETSTLDALGDNEAITRYMRWNTHLLSLSPSAAPKIASRLQTLQKAVKRPVPVPDAIAAEAMLQELQGAGPEALLERQGGYDVYAVTGRQAPLVLREIGRLRELTFRAVGEGTGKALDLDRFDHYYTHIVLWNREKQEIVGAYRMGHAREIVQEYGVRGLYTSSLFHYDPHFFDEIAPAVELGRSFVRTEYQRQYAPLLLLWKGIAGYIARHPEMPLLFGAVSISNEYSPASRELIVNFLRSHMAEERLVSMIAPKHPPRQSRESRETMVQQEIFARAFSLDDISRQVSAFEADGKNVPILLKHYLKLGGSMLAFNVDPKFSNVLDGLLIVDLREAGVSLLEKYMGRPGCQSFLGYHGISATRSKDAGKTISIAG